MNNRHRRIARLKKQELNAAKKKFEKKYGISADNATKIVNEFIDAFGKIAEGAGNAIASFGRSLQSK
ncbi:toxin PIN [Enterococcus hirae]|nr:toxin PIN [Enterococcus hirae]EMF0264231.1 toxin PIN [Enterococcus hirae]EMF0457153.1 toxin PIN [Enterococcus hirae]